MPLGTPDKRWIQDFGDNRWVEIDGAYDAISPANSKGDLVVQTSGGNVRLPVGRNGQVPIALSSTTEGIQWDEAVNPRYKTVFFDDYTGYYSVSYVGTTGTGASVFGATSLGNPGQLGVTTGTTATGGGLIGIPAQNRIINTQRELYLEDLIYLEALSTASQEYVVFVGFNDNGTTISASHPNNGAYFYYDRAASGDFWVCRTVNGGAATTTVSIWSVNALTFTRLKIRAGVSNGSSVVQFEINGNVAAVHTTNIPTGALSFTKSIKKTAGTTSRYLLTDYCYFTEEVSR